MNQEIRNDFPILKDGKYVYFDNAATTQRPTPVLDAIRRFDETTNSNPLRGLYQWSIKATEEYEDARRLAASFINAESSDEIVFTRNTTESINLIAYRNRHAPSWPNIWPAASIPKRPPSTSKVMCRRPLSCISTSI